MKDLKAIRGKYYLDRIIAEGEHERQDFKYSISDARKIARTLSAFANHSGGRLLIGVRDNGSIAGVRNEEDIFVLEQAAEMYCLPAQKLTVTAIQAEGGAIVIRAEIEPSEVRPVKVKEEGGRLKAYYRVDDENIAAHPLMIRSWNAARENNNLTIGVNETLLLETLRQLGENLSPETLISKIRLSRQIAEDTLVRLAAAGIIEFSHSDTGFILTLP